MKAFISIPVALLALGLTLPLPTSAASVRIRSCYDADTCRTTTGERIRLACVDAPEVGQPGAYRATQTTRSLVEGRTVGIRRLTRDRYGRTVAELYSGGVNVGQELVRRGDARVHTRYSWQCPWAR